MYDANARYKFFNDKLFGGQLPDVPVVLRRLKGIAGQATAKFRSGRLVPDSIKVTLDTTYKRSSDFLDNTLIHEMIHVYHYMWSMKDEGHGPSFVSMAKKFGGILGFPIALTEEIDDLEFDMDVVKPVGVVMVLTKKGWLYALMNEKALRLAVKNGLFFAPDNIGFSNGKYGPVIAGVSKDPFWLSRAQGKREGRRVTSLSFFAGVDASAYGILHKGEILLDHKAADGHMTAATKTTVAKALRAAAAKLTAGSMSLLDKLFLATLLNKETVELVAEEARHLAVKSKGAADAATLRKQLATDESLLDALTHGAKAAAPRLHKVLDKYLERFNHRGRNIAIGDGGAVFIEVENKALAIRFEAVSDERVWDDPGINGEPLGDDDFTFNDDMGADVSDFLSKVLTPADVSVGPEVFSENGLDFFAYSIGVTHSLPKDFVEQVLRGLEQRFPAELAKAIDEGIADAAE